MREIDHLLLLPFRLQYSLSASHVLGNRLIRDKKLLQKADGRLIIIDRRTAEWKGYPADKQRTTPATSKDSVA